MFAHQLKAACWCSLDVLGAFARVGCYSMRMSVCNLHFNLLLSVSLSLSLSLSLSHRRLAQHFVNQVWAKVSTSLFYPVEVRSIGTCSCLLPGLCAFKHAGKLVRPRLAVNRQMRLKQSGTGCSRSAKSLSQCIPHHSSGPTYDLTMAWLHGFEVQGSGRKRGAVSAERGQLSWSLSGLQAQPTPQHPSIDEPPPEPKLPLAALPLPCAPQADGHAAITPVPCLRVACSGDWEGESAPC